jgi:DNA mismatch repair protein MutS
MVEMSETSAILHSATARSLVLLDEIGRGTSTYDGVSIAWAVSEHLHNRTGCKTIFATHYHELTQLTQDLDAVRNFNVAVREVNDDVLFLHRLQAGGADRSYGIEVGRLAGLPKEVLARARDVLKVLEGEQLAATKRSNGGTREQSERSHDQLGLFASARNPLVDRLAAIDADTMTPLQALSLLAELSRDAKRS